MGKHSRRPPYQPDDRDSETNPVKRVRPTLADLVQLETNPAFGSRTHSGVSDVSLPDSTNQKTNHPPIERSDRLVHPYPGVDPEPSEPTNPDLWGSDDPGDEYDKNRSRRAALGAVLLSVVITVVVGGLGWTFGAGSADHDRPEMVYRTIERAVTVPVTETATKLKRKIVTRDPDVVPTVTVVKTLPARPVPTITKTVRHTVRATAILTEIEEVPVQVTVTETVTEVP